MKCNTVKPKLIYVLLFLGFSFIFFAAGTYNEATGLTGDYTCDYGAGNQGVYTIRIKDNSGTGTGFPRFTPGVTYVANDDRLKLLTIEQWGTGKWSSMERAFENCYALQMRAIDTPDLSNVTNMSRMFSGADVFNQDIGSWVQVA